MASVEIHTDPTVSTDEGHERPRRPMPGTGGAAAGRPRDPERADAARDAAEDPSSAPPDASEPSGGPSGPTPPRVRRLAGSFRGPRTWVALALAVLLAAAIVCGIGWYRAENHASSLQQTADLRASASQAAREAVVDVLTYDYQHLPAQQHKIAAESTKDFVKNFKKSMKTLGKIFTQYQASASGSILDAAVKSVSSGAAILLMHVNQKADSTAMKSPKNETSFLRVTMVRKDGTWLLDKVTLLAQDNALTSPSSPTNSSSPSSPTNSSGPSSPSSPSSPSGQVTK